MTLEVSQNKKNYSAPPLDDEDFELNFKPITSGLGFHPQKNSDLKPAFSDKPPIPVAMPGSLSIKKETNVYQDDLSNFYQKTTPHLSSNSLNISAEIETPNEVIPNYALATKTRRFFAHILDLLLIFSSLLGILTLMAKSIEMDIWDIWINYPDDITPLSITLFCGFYLLYFSIFEKANQSTFGKGLFGLRVVNHQNKPLPFGALFIRSFFSLLNFISLGIFSYFDLQNKVSSSKVVKIN